MGDDDPLDGPARHFLCKLGTDHYDTTFGMRLRMQSVPVYAERTVDEWLKFIDDVVDAIHMQKAHPPFVFEYPGVGVTIVQPVIESCLILDLWDRHKAGYLIIATCGGLKTTAITEVAAKHGVVVGFGMAGELRLD